MESASALIDQKIEQLGDWRGEMLAQLRQLIHQADPGIIEEWKWVKPTNPGTPVWSHDGIICTGETYKQVVKLTFARGAAIERSMNQASKNSDAKKLFNSSLEGNMRRAIDIREGEKIKGDKIKEAAFKELIRAAVAANLESRLQSSSKKRTGTKRAGARAAAPAHAAAPRTASKALLKKK